ncbi:MAG TPA: ATP-binding protein [Burkholderiaceae bacterium]|nr:ATP-binding protein [Burkholderiaceae bacterium]
MAAERGFVIALLGAESTGKTTLALALRDALAAQARSALVVPEYLREFCDRHRRTPRQDEQAGIAAEQTRRIDAAAQAHDLVIADTTALMIAVYSEQVFGDASLYPSAEAAQRACDLSLLTALDLPWQADGLQRDGPQVREPVDAKVRAALARAGTPYSVVFGSGAARLAAALASVQRARAPRSGGDDASDGEVARWHWRCERCGDPNCERHGLLPRG